MLVSADTPEFVDGNKSDIILRDFNVTFIDTLLGGCFYNSIYNCIDAEYRKLDNTGKGYYINLEKEKILEHLKNNFDTLGNGFFTEVSNDSYSFETIKNEIMTNVNVGYELLPLFESYFDINIYIMDMINLKGYNICKIEKENKNCIILGYRDEHFVSVAQKKDDKYITNFSYNNIFLSLVR